MEAKQTIPIPKSTQPPQQNNRKKILNNQQVLTESQKN